MSAASARLKVLTGPLAGRDVQVTAEGITLGRPRGSGGPAHVPIADAGEANVSREHAFVGHDVARGGWWAELRSHVNPMWVDGQELAPGAGLGRVALGEVALLRFPGRGGELLALFTAPRTEASARLDAELLRDIDDALRFGRRRREGLDEALSQLQGAFTRIEDLLRRADPAALRAEIEDQLAHREGSLRDAVARLDDVGASLDDALEALARVVRSAPEP